ncbi:hypothetical protein [Phenylobacterium koreense]|uniref:Uncharacterized protein n=1 Tax=Phenylobacterium koreense TaxID=266125 RepID=A0ABV2EN76_9CAUL
MSARRGFQVVGALVVLAAMAGCSRADVVRVATNVRVGAERAGGEAEQARTIRSLNEGAPVAAVAAPPSGDAAQPAQTPPEAPKTPLWLQPGSPYAPSAPAESAPQD